MRAVEHLLVLVAGDEIESERGRGILQRHREIRLADEDAVEDGRLATDMPRPHENAGEPRRHAPRQRAMLLSAALRQLAAHVLVCVGNPADIRQERLARFRKSVRRLRLLERGERIGDERPGQPPRTMPSVVRDVERLEPLRRRRVVYFGKLVGMVY